MSTQAFFMGLATCGFLVAALFFLRFWLKTRDQLFGAFSLAFLLLAVERILLFIAWDDQPHSAYYLLRLLSFFAIGLAIFRKNREA